MTTYADQWHDAADALRRHAAKMDDLAEAAPKRPAHSRSALKVAICEYMLKINEDSEGPPWFIPPVAIDWIGNGIVDEILKLDEEI